MNDIICFELNNWFAERDYPDVEPFLTWMDDDNIYDEKYLTDDKWAKENNICVAAECIDMSVNVCVTSSKEWVEKNCPELLTKYTTFLRTHDENGDTYGRFGTKFLTYDQKHFGVTWIRCSD